MDPTVTAPEAWVSWHPGVADLTELQEAMPWAILLPFVTAVETLLTSSVLSAKPERNNRGTHTGLGL